ncbi:H-NS family nucleoid-associated regulatory protein [Falsirhodobacter halotolerans]|uniref:H-NS histone family protein n=1 Tax=Falsirhodobacter halotolerans TaxID=1146892 RepID=UPI001FD478B4|nr:H-NS histone family protein [Falsirhodobacter halotolerans]MCJ8138235.1 H-NS histone family protein [Falsirhodobacter halotolerans]
MDLNEMSLKDLKEMKQQVERAISTFEIRRKREVAAKLEAEARDLGFSLQDLAAATQTRRRSPAAPKYANPDAPDETWSGRGRKPRWFADAIEAGKTPEDLAV